MSVSAATLEITRMQNEIERLRAENERLHKLIELEQNSQYAENAKLQAEVKHLRAAFEQVGRCVRAALNEETK